MKLSNRLEPVNSTTRHVPAPTPRRSGLTDLQLVLLGKGPAARLRRPMSPSETTAYLARQEVRA